jgi:hypothetical protein
MAPPDQMTNSASAPFPAVDSSLRAPARAGLEGPGARPGSPAWAPVTLGFVTGPRRHYRPCYRGLGRRVGAGVVRVITATRWPIHAGAHMDLQALLPGAGAAVVGLRVARCRRLARRGFVMDCTIVPAPPPAAGGAGA